LKIKKFPFHYLFVFFLLSFLIVYHYPYVLGKMFGDPEDENAGYFYKFGLGYHVKFPQYIFDAAQWINNFDEEFRILLLPDQKANAYTWGFAGTGDITWELFNKGILFRSYGEGQSPPSPAEAIYNLAIDSLYKSSEPNSTEFVKLLGLLNVKFILQRDDFLFNFFGDTDSPAFIKKKLGMQKGVKFSRSFGAWKFYEIENYAPRIHTVCHVTLINSQKDPKEWVKPWLNFQPDHALILGNIKNPEVLKNLACDEKQSDQNKKPLLTFKKINPTVYIVDVNSSQKPILLVLNNSFHEGWKAFIVNESGEENQINEHIQVNGYANGWILPSMKQSPLQVRLEFYPQRLFEIGIVISGSTFLIVLVWSLVQRYRTKKIKPESIPGM
jgi:hypothetical protein